jgi:predicted O-methyltransferase YrrM
MSEKNQWSAVDRYLAEKSIAPDDVLDATLAASAAAELPAIAVTPHQGKFLHLLAKLKGARRILEIGTLGGYSTIWLARALPPDGRIVTLELEPRHAEVARRNFERAGIASRVDLRVGRAAATLARLVEDRVEPFDFVFIDADKPSMAEYFQRALQLSRVGTVIIADNVVRNGAVVDPASADPSVQGVRAFMDVLAKETRVSATTLQTVGSKGYDGFTMALVVS